MIPAGAVVAAARGWIGVPYLHQGRSRSGIDCIGLVLQVAREAGIGPADLDFRRYGRMPQREMIEAELPRWCAPGEAQAGALVVVRWTTAAAHLAICTGPSLIHACASRKQVVEHGYRGVWQRLTHSVWLLPGVRYE